MPAGQYEAAKVLGYSKGQTFFKIILPQVMKRILPPVTNETITLVKDTSLAFVLAEAEMFTIAKQIAAKETSVMPLMAAGVFYYIFNLAVAFGMEYIEKKMNYYRQKAAKKGKWDESTGNWAYEKEFWRCGGFEGYFLIGEGRGGGIHHRAFRFRQIYVAQVCHDVGKNGWGRTEISGGGGGLGGKRTVHLCGKAEEKGDTQTFRAGIPEF